MRNEFSGIPLPPEHRTYGVGEEVNYGAHDEAVILSVSEDGRIYEVEVTNYRKKSYSDEVTVDKKTQTVDWTRLLPMSSMELDREPFGDITYRPIQYCQQSLDSLLHRAYSMYGLDFDPYYQRGHVWELEDKEALIESVFAQRDIGKFVFNDRGYHEDKDCMEVIDGKQRLTALREFYEDRFKYKGLYYSELHPKDRNIFRNHNVSVASLNEASDTMLLETFLAVNITGKVQNLDHIEYVKELREKLNEGEE